MAYNKEEAEAIAAKREAHKPKHMVMKTWQAVPDEAGGYEVKLVESAHAKQQARQEQRREETEEVRSAFARAMSNGDFALMRQIAEEGLLIKVRNALEDFASQKLPGESDEEAFARIYRQNETADVEEDIQKQRARLIRSAGLKP